MKIFIAGDWHSKLHEEVVALNLAGLGHEVLKFGWHNYFTTKNLFFLHQYWLRAQNKYIFGRQVSRLNRDLLTAVSDSKPNLIFIYRGTHVYPETLCGIRSSVPGIVIVGYNNDDPFSPYQPRFLWRHFIASIPEYDLMLAYRHANLDDFLNHGAKRVELLRSWYVPERNYPVTLNDEQLKQFSCDVVFVGHYESDQRSTCLERIAKEGIHLRLYGPGYEWNSKIRKSPWLADQFPVRPMWDKEYNLALAGAKIALCFFSKLNRDTYTRRCFEIPATGTLLLSEYSDDIASLFQEGVEADFFRDEEEMILKIKQYLSDEWLLRMVSKAGHQRLIAGRHDIRSRMEQVLRFVSAIQRER